MSAPEQAGKDAAIRTSAVEYYPVEAKGDHVGSSRGSPTPLDGSDSKAPRHGEPELVDNGNDVPSSSAAAAAVEAQKRSFFAAIRTSRHQWFAYIKTKEFWIVLGLGQVLALCITGTNTFSSLLSYENASMPALQTLFNYVLLNCIYTSYTIYQYGFKKWAKMLLARGWKYFILAFLDACGNYFFVLAYRYTNLLSAQLINFWAIVVVVIVSFTVLRVRYRITQYAGILICIGGMGILLGSDRINGSSIKDGTNPLKGDLFCLAGATFYGLSNTFEEFLVSKEPTYEVIGQLAFWATPIMGVIAAVFDRDAIKMAQWTPTVGGHLIGYTLILALFYSLAPLMFRLSSAAFFNISLLTANFWGAIIGIHVFHIPIHFMYPIAFVLIVLGLTIYFLSESLLGEAKKPWLGENQEQGVSGLGTARRMAERKATAAVEQGQAGNAV